MKKVILMLLVILLGAQLAGAQIVRSQSRSITVTEEKKEKVKKVRVNYGHDWVVKLGGGVNITDGSNGNYTSFNYNFSFSYQHILNSHGLYLGGQVGITASNGEDFYQVYYGNKYWEYHWYPRQKQGLGLYIGPTLGIKLEISDKIKFDPHVGVSYMHSFNGWNDSERMQWELGLGLWFNRFLVEIEYAGTMPVHDISNAILLNLGFRF